MSPEVAGQVFAAVLERQKEWSERTIGPGARTLGLTRHIEKECQEIREAPGDLSEWIDIIILGLDGFWRAGGAPEDLYRALDTKMTINQQRTYPRVPEDQPSEHVRES